MSESATPTRLPMRSVVASYVHTLPAMVGLVGVGLIYTMRPQTWPGSWVVLLVALLIAVRLIHPILRWAATRYVVTPELLLVEHGVWVRRRSTASWDSVAVRELTQPWAYRVFDLSLVCLRVGGESTEGGSITLVGLDTATARSLVRIGAASISSEREVIAEGRGPAAAQEDPTVLIHRATGWQLLAGGLAQGQIVIAGIATIYALVEGLDAVGLWQFDRYLALGLPLLLMIALVTTLILGMLATLIRFHGLKVRRRSDEITISYGLVDRRERVIRQGALVGFRVHRNIIEMLLDRVRVILLTQDASAGSGGANVALPSLPRGVVSALLMSIDEETLLPPIVKRRGTRALGTSLLAVLVVTTSTTAVVALGAVAEMPRGLLIMVAVLTGVVALWGCRLVSTRVTVAGTRVHARQHHLYERHDIVRLLAVHLVTRTAVGASHMEFCRIHYFAGAGRTISAFCRDRETVKQLTHALAMTASGVACDRIKKGPVLR